MNRREVGAATWRVGLHVLAIAAIVFVLWRGLRFLELAAVALVLAAALETPVGALVRHGWRRGLAIAAVCLTVALVLAGATAFLVPRIAPQIDAAARAVPDLASQVRESPQFRWLQEHELLRRVASELRQHVGATIQAMVAAAMGIASFAGAVVTVAAMTVFLLVSGSSAWGWLLRWVHPSRRARARNVGAAVRSAVAGYVGGALVMGAIAASVTGTTTGLLGVPFFLALAVVTFALGIIPFIGAIVSGALVVVATWATAGTTAAMIALGVFVGYQQLEGTVLQPLVQRHAVAMSPLVVLSAVLLGMSAGGVFGGVLALPLAAAAKVIAEDVLKHRRRQWRRPSAGETSLQAAEPASARGIGGGSVRGGPRKGEAGPPSSQEVR